MEEKVEHEWSIKAIQDIVLEQETWEKKNLYATDSGKCPMGLYLSLTGVVANLPIDPKGLRRMEVGQMIEKNQIEKLKSLGILIEAQRRIYDEEGNVSGRHDGIIISPIFCTAEAKEMISRKAEIFKELKLLDKHFWEIIEKYNEGTMDRDRFIREMNTLTEERTDLYDEDKVLNAALLVPNPENHLIVNEIKSIVEKGFEWRIKDNAPMEDHQKQAMFYLWKLREKYSNIKARVIYVDTSYQNLLEFDVELDLALLGDMKRFWKSINESVQTKVPPPPAPDIVYDTKYRRWKINHVADWCRYHDQCTGKPNWKDIAMKKVEELNTKPK